jgi:hypothetical protein
MVSCLDGVKNWIDLRDNTPVPHGGEIDETNFTDFIKYLDKIRGNEGYFWVSTSGYLSQHLENFEGLTRDDEDSLSKAGLLTLAGISFALLTVMGFIEAVVRPILGLGVVPLAFLANYLGALDEKTYNALYAMTLSGIYYGRSDALGSLGGTTFTLYNSATTFSSALACRTNPQANTP